MICRNCGFDSVAGMKFCGKCGAELRVSCPSCGAAVDAVTLTCSACGLPIQSSPVPSSEPCLPAKPPPASSDEMSIIKKYLTPQLSEKILAARGRIEGERRQVTALFADIQGYTPLSEALGEEATFKVMDRIYECMISAVVEEEGIVQELTGDGIFALFGAPIALEDAPVRACRAALAMQKKMLSLVEELYARLNFRPLVRIGIHTGPVVIGTLGTDLRMEFKAVGDTVNLASRLESVAEPGHIFISESTYVLVEPYVDCLCTGEHQIRGKAKPQKVYHLEGIKEQALRFEASIERGLTPLAGRLEELDQLERYCEKAFQGTVQLILLTGEAGVGKSRVVHELKRRLEKNRVLFLQSNCTSYGRSTSLMPFIHLVRTLFHIDDHDNLTAVERKVRQGLDLFGMDCEAATPYVLALLGFKEDMDSLTGVDAKIIGDRTRETLKSLLKSRCRLCSTVFAVEDLHWIDPASENLLGQIIREEPAMPLLILCTARPSYKSAWAENMNIKKLQLAPLSREGAVQMVRAILGCDTIDDHLSKMVVEQTGCNPLYTEEMTRYLLETGSVTRTRGSATCRFAEGAVIAPMTILDLLQSRIDRLEEGPKTLLEAAAVIGQRFSPELARQVSGLGDCFDRHLRELETSGLIFREQSEEQVIYRFRHTLLQDAVCNSMLKERREKLHRLVGETMERLYFDRLNEWANTLAYHWGNTGDTGKAVQYLTMAGEKSYWVCALEEAHERFRKAMELIEKVPGCVNGLFIADLLVKWGRVFLYRADFLSLRTLLEPYLPEMEELGDRRRLSLVLSWLALSHVFAGNGSLAKPLLERALSIADEIGDAECIAMAARSFVWLYTCWIPDSAESDVMVDRYYRLAVESAEKTDNLLVMTGATVARAIFARWMGRYPEARSFSSKLVDIGRRFRDTRSLSYAQWSLGYTHLNDERFQEALECAEQSLQLSPDPLDELCASGVKGVALSCLGKVSEGLEIVSDVRGRIVTSGFLPLLAALDMPYGAVLVRAGHLEKGVRHLKDAIEFWRSMGNFSVPVWGHLFLGEIYSWILTGSVKPAPGTFKAMMHMKCTRLFGYRHAYGHFMEALNSARAYNMPGIVGRALYGLGLLSRMKNRREEARSFFVEALEVAEKSELYIACNIRSALNADPRRFY